MPDILSVAYISDTYGVTAEQFTLGAQQLIVARWGMIDGVDYYSRGDALTVVNLLVAPKNHEDRRAEVAKAKSAKKK